MSNILKASEALFNIYDKAGNLVPFRANQTQVAIDKIWNEDRVNRFAVLKARQEGVSTWVMIDFLIECLAKHCTCVMLAHDKDHTEKLLMRARLILQNMNGPKPKTGRLNDNEIFFTKTQSSFYIGTAGSVNFGRSATITHLHCSEIAFWKDPKTLLTGLLQAVPKDTGVVIQETTANGWGNWFQKRYYSYRAKGKPFKALFFPWFAHQEYQASTPAPLPLSEYENWLANDLGLNSLQLQWRREKLDEFEGDETLFKQEYPAIVEEAFRVTGGSLFSDVKLSDSREMKPYDSFSRILPPHPQSNLTYVFGADSSGGTGNDSAAIVGICLETREVIYVFDDPSTSPPVFGRYLSELGKKFNNAYIVPESNSHGLSTIAVLKPLYPLNRIYRSILQKQPTSAALNIPSYGYGWKTTSLSKPYMVGVAQQLIASGILIFDEMLFDQLLSFSETEDGKLQGSGDHDDLAIAFMLACLGTVKIAKNPTLYGNVINLAEKRKEKEVKIFNKDIASQDITWRDSEGRYLQRFDDVFKKKVQRLL